MTISGCSLFDWKSHTHDGSSKALKSPTSLWVVPRHCPSMICRGIIAASNSRRFSAESRLDAAAPGAPDPVVPASAFMEIFGMAGTAAGCTFVVFCSGDWGVAVVVAAGETGGAAVGGFAASSAQPTQEQASIPNPSQYHRDSILQDMPSSSLKLLRATRSSIRIQGNRKGCTSQDPGRARMSQGRKGAYSFTLRPGCRQFSMCHVPVPAGTRRQIWSGCLRSGHFPQRISPGRMRVPSRKPFPSNQRRC